MPQGCIVKRQRVPRSLHCANEDFLSVLDLNVQKQVKIFDQTYNITDCDGFTRAYLCKAGIVVPEPTQIPE